MKKYIGIFAAMLLCALLALSAFAAETVVYVNDGGTGDGSSASAPLGNMTEAINKIANGGKVVITDTYTMLDAIYEPTHKGDIIQHARFAYIGNNKNGVNCGALRTVARNTAHSERILAGTLCNKRGRPAAVAVCRPFASERQH